MSNEGDMQRSKQKSEIILLGTRLKVQKIFYSEKFLLMPVIIISFMTVKNFPRK